MDLTLIRSRHFWRVAEQTLLSYLGLDPETDVHHCYNGMHAIDAGKAIHALLKPSVSADQCVAVFRDALIEQFQTQPIVAMPGAVELVQRYAGKLPMAIASGSPPEGIHAAAKALGFDEHLDVALSGESVARGKPEPDVFLEAARLLGVTPQDCVVFEDSVTGATAAVRAGMVCIVAPDEPVENFGSLPVHFVGSLAEVDDALLAKVHASLGK
jgi:HAD superfamily hydrolase (TIGR01509 family)